MARKNTPKRKRSAASTSLSEEGRSNSISSPSTGVINPLSHTPGTLTQLQTAGLADADEVPSKDQLRFPHRPWKDPTTPKKPRRRKSSSVKVPSGSPNDEQEGRASSVAATESGLETGTDADPGGALLPQPKSYPAERVALQPLARSIPIFLARGDVPAAKRAFGLLMRSHISGKPVDIRRNHYWELGAEILMREQPLSEVKRMPSPEIDDAEEGHRAHQPRQPLYPAANVPRVKAYFEDLIRRHPHHLGARKAASALQFLPAQLSYELFQIHTQLRDALQALDVEAEAWAEDDIGPESEIFEHRVKVEGGRDVSSDSEVDGGSRSPILTRDAQLRRAKDELRTAALAPMRDIAKRMDADLENLPFSRSPEMWRLRGMVSLYLADLLIPLQDHGQRLKKETDAGSTAERDAAKEHFKKMEDLGGSLERVVGESLGMEREDSEGPSVTFFSSLPIRDLRP